MQLSEEDRQRLIDAANAARSHSYAPYSNYPVGAAILADSGATYVGTNVENASYPLSMCAERSAVFQAVARGERSFRAIAVITENGGAPCGACRQVLSEFGLDTIVIVADGSGKIHLAQSVGELLPKAFGPSDLGLDSD
jgi:cytidine deaminase